MTSTERSPKDDMEIRDLATPFQASLTAHTQDLSTQRRGPLRDWAIRAAIAGVAIFAVGCVFHMVSEWLTPKLVEAYANANLFRPWLGWTRTYMLLHPVGMGLVFAWVHPQLAHPNVASGIRAVILSGAAGGGKLFIAGSLPVFLLMFASTRVTLPVMLAWILQNAAQYILTGACLGLFSMRSGLVAIPSK